MISNISVGVSNESPLVLTTSVVQVSDIDPVALEKLINISVSADKSHIIKVNKHIFDPNSAFFSYNAFEMIDGSDKQNLTSLTSLFINRAPEPIFVSVIRSFIHAIATLELSGISVHQVHIVPKEIYITANNEIRLIVIPLINYIQTNYAEFFAELFARLPFAASDSLFSEVLQYFNSHLANYSFAKLDNIIDDSIIDDSIINDSIIDNVNDSANNNAFTNASSTQSAAEATLRSTPRPTSRIGQQIETDKKEPLQSPVQESSQVLTQGVLQNLEQEQSTTQAKDPSQGTKLPQINIARLVDIKTNNEATINKFPYTIGRSKDFSDLVLDNPKISSVHCRIIQGDQGGLQIVDTNSTNHVRINEERIAPSIPQDLRTGDLIRLADITFRIQF